MDERPRCETGIHQNPRGQLRQQPLQHRPKQNFHDTSPKARETKDKMNLWDFMKIKCFCTVKETVKKTKTKNKKPKTKNKQKKPLRGSSWNGRIYLQMMLRIKDSYPRSTKNFSNSMCEKQVNKS